VLSSKADTLGVDAFILSVIMAEKQARRLVTYLVYQHSWCSPRSIPELKKALESSQRVYFAGVLRGWDALYPCSVEQLVGAQYARLKTRLDEAKGYRDKIFHGQLTSKGLSTSQLVALAQDIRAWCEAFGGGAQAAVGYDGCGRDSFRKARNASALSATYKEQLASLADYRTFICRHMESGPKNRSTQRSAAPLRTAPSGG
jgi:hypothetical protein